MAKDKPTIERLRQVLRYEPETGLLFWLERPELPWWSRRWAGQPALTALASGGYKRGWVLGRRQLAAHVVGWALYHGEWPTGPLDHINGIRTDNRIANLRAVTPGENNRNARRRKDNKSGVTGVYWTAQRRKWQAYIKAEGKHRVLGFFVEKMDAIAARKKAEREYGFHPNHGSEPAAINGGRS